jgi:predicted transcriptional regulator
MLDDLSIKEFSVESPAPHITDAEWAVLERLWQQGAAPVRALADGLYPDGGASEYATVHKLLERLKSKGYVSRQKRGGIYLFEPAQGRDEVVGRQLEVVVGKLCGGSVPMLLSNLVRVKRLTPGELRELQELVKSLETASRLKKDGR